MKIAIVAPSPVPFTIGGAENLFWGLQQYINDETPHQCELVKLPSREHGFKDLIRTYREFSRLDLSHFDMVISTKYPSWMVRHPNHVCYMLHRLRGLYDTYHFVGLPERFEWQGPELAEAYTLMNAARKDAESNKSLEVLFEYLLSLDERKLPPGAMDFPGPFAREVVHFLDEVACSTSRIKRYVAISENVRRRIDYFPSNAKVEVAYPPPKIPAFECGRQEYLFTVSRLDGPKRISLLVEAMRHVRSELPLYIAGTGPDEQNIKRLAEGDSRIKFLGFVNDHDLVNWYRDALAIPFIPYDEDYGLIAIEAMMSGKPVLTLTDSGGPNEFVDNGVTGLSVAPSAEALAAGIDALFEDKNATREMGCKAKQRVSAISWANVVETLFGEVDPREPAIGNRRRPRVAVALTFPVYPPRGGGQSRVFHLYRNLACYADVELITSCQPQDEAFHGEIAPGLVETRVPRSQAHMDAENEYSQSVDWIPITDVVMSELLKLTPDFEQALRKACEEADIVVACHPYLSDALRRFAPNKPLWFEAQDVEFILKSHIFPDTEAGRVLLDKVRRDEESCWRNASLVFACAQSDIDELTRLYGQTVAETFEVPNGVALENVPFVSSKERKILRTRVGLDGLKTILFMGSWHGPNLVAVERIFECASVLGDVTFIILGSACGAFANRAVPENVRLMGVVDDDEKAVLLGSVDFCINPMTGGSGSNLKMLDYFASGTPVISTAFGARGISAAPMVHFLPVDVMDMSDAIQRAYSLDAREVEEMARSSRRLVEERYQWKVIVDEFALATGLAGPSVQLPSPAVGRDG